MKFSIVTAVKNAEHLLPITLASVTSQQLKDDVEIEHIIIDGKSNDNSLRIIETYVSSLQHPLSSSVISELDTGIYDAMDKGRALATGDFVLFLNAGDEFSSNSTIETVKQFIQGIEFKNRMSSVYYGKTLIQTKHTNWSVPSDPHDSSKKKKNGMRYYYPHHQSIFYPKSFYTNHSYDKSFVICGDVDYTIRACSNYLVNYMCLDISKIQLGGFGTSKLTFSRLKKFYLDEVKLQKMHRNIYTQFDTLTSLRNYLAKYIIDNIIGTDEKYYVMSLIQRAKDKVT
jgi:glycosyltransferase involved in cell wall biosynthesis